MIRRPKNKAGLEAAAGLPSGPAGLNARWTVLGVCVFLAAIIWVIYGRTVRYEFVNYDDGLYVFQNPEVIKGLTFRGMVQVFTHSVCDLYHPLTMLSLMLDAQIYGLNAGGYHLTNVLLHAATTILLFLVLRRMLGLHSKKSAGAAAPPAGVLWPIAFVAAVFAIHPLRVESVAWVTERKDMLSGLFFMLTLGAYVRYVEESKVQGSKSRVWYGLMLLAFTLGLLSKPSLVTLPFVLLLLDYWPLQRFALGPVFLEKVPLFVLSAAASVVTIFTQQAAISPVGVFPLPLRLGNAAVSYLTYLGQIFYPAGLAVVYPYPETGLPQREIVLALVLLTGITAGAVAQRTKRPYLVVGWLWYVGMLVPNIGVVQAGIVARADRFTYLPQIGVYLAIAMAVRDLTVSWRYRRQILGAGAITVIVALMVCAWIQTSYWRNSELLWTHTLAGTADNFIAENNLGVALRQEGKVNEAIAHYQMALRIKPDYSQAQNNLGNALLQKGKVDEAIPHYQKALQIEPDYADAHYNLGKALVQKGKVDEAIPHYQKALQIKPDDEDTLNDLGNALLQKGDVDEAIFCYQKALQIKPGYVEAHINLGIVLLQKGNVDEAIEHYQMALQIEPDFEEAQNNLGNALFQKGRVNEAIAHYQKALQIKPDYAEAQNNLAWVLATAPQAAMRNGNQAVKLAQQANQLGGGNNPIFLRTLAAAYAETGRFGDAMESAQKAVKLAQIAGQPDIVARLNGELKLYQAGLPFHEEGK